MQVPPDHIHRVLDSFFYEAVADCIDFDSIGDFEHRLAVALGRIDGTTDEQMVAWSRALIASALRRLADRWENGPELADDVACRYMNALARSADA